jgi:hypothetical protein
MCIHDLGGLRPYQRHCTSTFTFPLGNTFVCVESGASSNTSATGAFRIDPLEMRTAGTPLTCPRPKGLQCHLINERLGMSLQLLLQSKGGSIHRRAWGLE